MVTQERKGHKIMEFEEILEWPSINEKMTRNQSRWSGHEQRRSLEALMK